MRFHRRDRLAFLIIIITLWMSALSYGQESIGLPFLKIGVGARQAGMAGVFTGVGDDVYTTYWNPGGLGHIRQWQWSAGYNRWFADVYQASVTFAKQFRIIGSRKTTLGFHASYLGMPSWDSTEGRRPAVSAGHIVAGVSVGQRLDWISRALAIGVNIRALSCRFDTYSAEGVSTDVGLLVKPDRFALGDAGMGIFDYGVVSLGVAMLHLGPTMTFDTEPTSLPRTLRAGASFKMGRYGGFSLLLAADAFNVQNRDWVFAGGAEVWWRDIVGVRAGYKRDGEDLGDFSFGVSLRWDDVVNSLLGLPTRFGDAVEVDFANAGYGDGLQQTYRGAVSHYPVAPEPFRLSDPQVVTARVMGETSTVTLNWEKAFDPDPFDKVAYLVLIDKDKQRVDRAVHQLERDMDAFMASALADSMLYCASVPATMFTCPVREGGVYHWAVAAYDLGHHARLAKRGREKVWRFVVETADLVVREIAFTPTPWITTTPEQGSLSISVANEGIAVPDSFRFVVQDVLVPETSGADTVARPLLDVVLPGMAAFQDTVFSIPWSTELMGPHRISASLDPASTIYELQKENNHRQDVFVSVPKGTLSAADTVEVVSTEYDYLEIPLVPEIYFAPHSSTVEPAYFSNGDALEPVLITLARRLRQNPGITMQIMGSIDALSGEEDESLADQRAENVRMQLQRLEVPPSQIVVVKDHPDKVLGRRPMPADPQDAQWLMEQNRVVTFRVAQENELTIFGPHKVDVETTIRDSVAFRVDIVSPGETRTWRIRGEPRSIDSKDLPFAQGVNLSGTLIWNGMDMFDLLVPRNQWYRYQLTLVDTLKRSFQTRPDSVFLLERRTIRRHEVFGAAKFAQTQPVYQFYWDRLMDIAREVVENKKLRVRFEGHACAVGPDGVNQRLSLQRAQSFTEAFKERLKAAYPDQYREVLTRIEAPVGYGEKVPMKVRLRANREEVLLGDNESPVGRYLNRRIMVALFKEY
jgi:outer membrane protein OmpA-like peptidoglycan-associated protein